jgi:hypothetical protein
MCFGLGLILQKWTQFRVFPDVVQLVLLGGLKLGLVGGVGWTAIPAMQFALA